MRVLILTVFLLSQGAIVGLNVFFFVRLSMGGGGATGGGGGGPSGYASFPSGGEDGEDGDQHKSQYTPPEY